MAAGKKTGGRRPGSKNKATKAREDVISASGLTPLEFMLKVLRDPLTEQAERMDAAKAAAPYVHPRLTAVEHKGDLTHHHHEAARTVLARLLPELVAGDTPAEVGKPH